MAGRYRTTKEKVLHGAGIDNVKDVVNKYGGTCVIRHDKEKFYFVIYIRLNGTGTLYVKSVLFLILQKNS